MSERSASKAGLYVDASNLSMNGGRGMRYDVLRDFACRGGAEAIRLNAYVSFDEDRADADRDYREGQFGFHSALRDFGFKVILKRVKWYVDDEGNRVAKANVDLDLAVDALLQSTNMDRVVLGTGDGDFVQVVRALQNRGCRVEVVAFDNVSGDLRREADLFMPGHLVPNLLPVGRAVRGGPPWGAPGSVVRGVCYSYDHSRGFGFLRFLNSLGGDLWKTDSRDPESPYRSVFCHVSQLPQDLDPQRLPSRSVILEFRIDVDPADPKKWQAKDVTLVNARGNDVAPAPANEDL